MSILTQEGIDQGTNEQEIKNQERYTYQPIINKPNHAESATQVITFIKHISLVPVLIKSQAILIQHFFVDPPDRQSSVETKLNSLRVPFGKIIIT